jgi:hypothetical protein
MPTSFFHRSRTLWIAAVLLMLASAAWQRLSGPTQPVSGAVRLGDSEIRYRLARSHETASNQPVGVEAAEGVQGEVRWRRHPTRDPWRAAALTRRGDRLEAWLPAQPAAGKLEYQVHLWHAGQQIVVPARPVVTRFKHRVNLALLVTHIAAMFASLLLSARAGLGALAGERACRLAAIALLLWVLGGCVLGPAVQKQAFDAWWTGIPFGHDLTDNKTLVAVVAWGWAVWRCRRPHGGRAAIVIATALTFVVFAIPHSTWGSEIDWSAPTSSTPSG